MTWTRFTNFSGAHTKYDERLEEANLLKMDNETNMNVKQRLESHIGEAITIFVTIAKTAQLAQLDKQVICD